MGDSKAKRQQSNPYQLKDRSEAEALVQKMSQQNGRVASIEEKIKTEAAPLPYDLTEIQREANHRYDFSAKKRCHWSKACMKPIKSSRIRGLIQNT